MKQRLSLRIVLFGFMFIASVQGVAQSFSVGRNLDAGFGRRILNDGIEPHVPQVFRNLDRMMNPDKIPVLKIEPMLVFSPTTVDFAVTLTSSNLRPPSCSEMSQRLKDNENRSSEISYYTNRINKRNALSASDLKKLTEITKTYLPEIAALASEMVQIDIVWTFHQHDSENGLRFTLFESGPQQDFSMFVVTGPGLGWDNSEGLSVPDYLKVEIDDNFHMSYTASILDFCFSENSIQVTGKNPHPFDESGDPVLKATWNRDLLQDIQIGSWDTKVRQDIRTIKENYKQRLQIQLGKPRPLIP